MRTDIASAGGGHKAPPSGGKGKKQEGGKLILAVVLLVVAAVVVAWSQGWILGGSKGDTGLSPEELAQQQQNFNAAQKETQKKIEQKQAIPAGS